VRRIPLALLSACLLVMVPVATTLGHAELRSAEPGPRDAISELPDALIARFTQDLRKNRTSIELRNENGDRVARGGKDPDRARVQLLPLPELQPGRYEVRWVTFSAEDDEIARGKYNFTVKAPAATRAPEPTAAACPSPVPTLTPYASAEPTLSDDPNATASAIPVASMAPDASLAPAASAIAGASPDPCAPQPADEADAELAADSDAAPEESSTR